MIGETETYLDECPIPIEHISALRGSVEVTSDEVPYLSMDPVSDATMYLTHACKFVCKRYYLSAGPLSNELNAKDWLIVLDRLRELSASTSTYWTGS